MTSKKVAKKGIYSLLHITFIGAFGEPKEHFEIEWIDEKGYLHHAPIMPPLRIIEYKFIFPRLKPYTKKEYMSILLDGIKKVSWSTKGFSDKLFGKPVKENLL